MEKAVITSLVQIYLGLSQWTNESGWQPDQIALSARPHPPRYPTSTSAIGKEIYTTHPLYKPYTHTPRYPTSNKDKEISATHPPNFIYLKPIHLDIQHPL